MVLFAGRSLFIYLFIFEVTAFLLQILNDVHGVKLLHVCTALVLVKGCVCTLSEKVQTPVF